MPRRNARTKRAKPRASARTADSSKPDTQRMAADLVRRGLANPLILGRPLMPYASRSHEHHDDEGGGVS